MKQVILVDCMNLVYRSHFAHQFLTSRGRPTGVIYGFLNNILKVARHYPQTPMIFCWDCKGPTWRHAVAPGVYKANRSKRDPKMKGILDTQRRQLKELLKQMGFRQIQAEMLEADDIIASLALAFDTKGYDRVFIYSGDHDFYQCISRKVGVIQGKAGVLKQVTEEDAYQETGILPEEYALLKSIAGDSSDNMKPVPGIAEKKALLLLEAGADPRFEDFKRHDKAVRLKIKILEEHWKAVHECYRVCKLPATAFMPKQCAENLAGIVDRATRFPNRKRRATKAESQILLKWMIEFFTRFELNEFIRRSSEFGRLV